MDARASQLIERLGLVAHPEGGCFRQVYRSSTTVQPADDRGARPSLTTIYFLLVSGEVSRWHRVASDEAWHYYEGDPLELWSADAGFSEITRHVLGLFRGLLVLVSIVSWVVYKSMRRGAKTLEFFAFLPVTVPGLVVGVACGVEGRCRRV